MNIELGPTIDYSQVPPVSEQKEINERIKNPYKRQVGGDHYTSLKIQPMEYALANNLNLAQGNVVKYVTRYKNKGGIADLKKAIHCIELLIKHENDLQNRDTTKRETN